MLAIAGTTVYSGFAYLWLTSGRRPPRTGTDLLDATPHHLITDPWAPAPTSLASVATGGLHGLYELILTGWHSPHRLRHAQLAHQQTQTRQRGTTPPQLARPDPPSEETTTMTVRLCLLLEERYRNDSLPLHLAHRLQQQGYHVDIVRPGGHLLDLAELIDSGNHDAWILKTVSGGPGLGLLEAGAEAGLTTINDARAIRAVRDKARAHLIAERHGLPVPPTWAATAPDAFAAVPAHHYPLVVKPADGSAGHAVHLITGPEDLDNLRTLHNGHSLLLGQPYVLNSGVDLKVYCIDGRLFGTECSSPLATGTDIERPVRLSAEISDLAHRVGEIFGLDLFGVDIVFGSDGPIIVDINDFPSFRRVPDAVNILADACLSLVWSGPRRSRVDLSRHAAPTRV
ncbi:ATP-grasp domain-containing protein [Nocardia sp. NPDC050710]|uniref:ATP-grasp domain-containing protein n=1 Tax=Nocardia sp. NPDC050710 TaxID=3157220 RepID=UPI0034076364